MRQGSEFRARRRKSLTGSPSTLEPHHLEDLRRSGLIDSTIISSGVYSASETEVRDLLGFRASAGLVFPYPRVSGHARVKPDKPFLDKDGKPAKYLSPKGGGNHLYIPDTLDQRVLTDTSRAIILTEGEKKTLAGIQAGYNVIGVSGVFSWLTSNGKGGTVPVPEMDWITWTGRQVYIVYDSDAARNSSIQAAEWLVGQELQNRGAIVKVARLPGPTPDEDRQHKLGNKFGLDDVLKVRGRRAVEEAIRNATRPRKPTIKSASTQKGADKETQAERVARYVLDHGHYRWAAETLWHYREGIYRQKGDDVVRGVAHQYLTRNGDWKSSVVEEALQYVILECRDPKKADLPAPDPRYINLRNGRLDIKTLTLLPHDPAALDYVQVPINFDAAATCPVVDRFFAETLVDGDKIAVVKIVPGISINGSRVVAERDGQVIVHPCLIFGGFDLLTAWLAWIRERYVDWWDVKALCSLLEGVRRQDGNREMSFTFVYRALTVEEVGGLRRVLRIPKLRILSEAARCALVSRGSRFAYRRSGGPGTPLAALGADDDPVSAILSEEHAPRADSDAEGLTF